MAELDPLRSAMRLLFEPRLTSWMSSRRLGANEQHLPADEAVAAC